MRLALILIVMVLASFVPDALAQPRMPSRREPKALAIHVLAQLFLFALFILLTARPIFSAFCSVGLLALMVVVSNAKYKTLREPFVFSDLSLFAQLFRHPRLYLPFIGLRAYAVGAVGVVLLGLGCWAEPPFAAHPLLPPVLGMAVCLALGYWLAARLPLVLDAAVDQRRHGFFAMFVAYLLNGLRPATLSVFRAAVDAGPFAPGGAADDIVSAQSFACSFRGDGAGAVDAAPLASGGAGSEPIDRATGTASVSTSAFVADSDVTSPADALLAADARPDVIVIQSESYFDARRVSGSVNGSAYAQLDRARQESVSWGQVAVPAWGANTMRTEFALLTGLAPEKLGYARFYPYAFLRRACASLPDWFHRRGYRTLAIHPYYADFFGRNRVFRLLNFEKFLDIVQFGEAQRSGPYVSDAAVADAILAALDEAPRDIPRLIFSMTMENHGPLHLETVQPGESKLRHTLGDDKTWQELTVYLRHVANADAMLGRLLAKLRARRRPAVVCFYGDHVPALSGAFRALGVMPERSDYFIWRNFGSRPARRQDVEIETLGAMVLAALQERQVAAPDDSMVELATSEKTVRT